MKATGAFTGETLRAADLASSGSGTDASIRVPRPIPDWMEGDIIFGKSMDYTRMPDRSLVAVYASDRKTITTLVGGFAPRLRAEKQDVGPPHYGIGLAGLVANGTYYLYKIKPNSGDLYDVSDDPFSFRMFENPDLMKEYHTQLHEKLAARGVEIEPIASDGQHEQHQAEEDLMQ